MLQTLADGNLSEGGYAKVAGPNGNLLYTLMTCVNSMSGPGLQALPYLAQEG